jgi:AGCS family alanine or glycine:cation symporter
MRFVNVRGFTHALAVTAGAHDSPEHPGEVTHFRALASALSATVGLGNIAGVAIAVSAGGPGATFWMVVAGFLGMSSKFAECTLGQMYRRVRPDGRIMGGAMHYLSEGLASLGRPRLGRALAVTFAIFCVGGSLGGGNSFQVSQSLNAIRLSVPLLEDHPWAYGLMMAVLVGVVILGGIQRIAAAAARIVPAMTAVYVGVCLFVLAAGLERIPWAFGEILRGAFAPDAAYGGFLGVLVTGFQRAAFSNEAGIGSSAIAHAAAKTEYPVREGIVALLEPFVDTIIICSLTALVIVLTGVYADPGCSELVERQEGAALTAAALRRVVPWFPHVLSLAVFLFAYSTMISWSYYGERCWAWLLGDRASVAFRWLFLVFTFLGSVITASNILAFGDLMVLAMAFPNLAGVVLLSGRVKSSLDDYWATLRSGTNRLG